MVEMGIVPGDPRRRQTKPTDVDRSRAAQLLRIHAEEGRLSSRELDEAIERVYRAATLADLDQLVGGMEGTGRIKAEVVMSQGLETSRPARRPRSFLERQLIYSGAWLALWVIIWAVTGFGDIWFALIALCSLSGFAFRLARGDRGRAGVFGAGSRRSLSR